ncbi:hypothetical protein BC829DRAFT_389842 [Chytridium lagenaria]|nr:hypothetical protein BC829DRAFT_389842 [Chytridium lagenaria]
MLSSVVGNVRPRPLDELSNQPAEVTLKILSYLPPKDLARIAEVNSHLYRLSNEDRLWKAQCTLRWSTKRHQKLTPPTRGLLAYRRRYVKEVGDGRKALDRSVLENSFVPFYSGKWKASYIAAEIDQYRQIITRDEVMEYEWIFGDFWAEEDEIRVKFWPDGTRSNVNKDKKWTRPRSQPWHINERGAIQVSSFPEHSVPSRTEDWGWTFSNGYVTYTSV